LIAAARQNCQKNGQQLADYLRFLAFSGAREKEALRVKWADADFERERVTIGADRLTKNWESRMVEFQSRLQQVCPQKEPWAFLEGTPYPLAMLRKPTCR
jgi:integrase